MVPRILLLTICLYACLARDQDEIKVWAVASGSQKIYHCPKSKWYRVGAGKEISECQAIREGYKPVLGDGCGSNCRKP
jgi:hypothetical protein